MPIRFGLAYDFRNPREWRQPWTEVYAAILDQIVEAEAMGFDCAWLTEHHFVEDGYTPAPVPLMTAIAMRTKKMKVSTDILLMPFYNAVRLAEELATVDILSGGRVMLGMGMGYRDEEYAAFGQTRSERLRRTTEGIDVLRGAWAEGPFSYQGRYYNLDNVDVMPKPAQAGGPPLWLATSSEPAARRAARLGLHVLPQGDKGAAYDAWLDELAKVGRRPEEFMIGMIKPCFVADSRNDPMWVEVSERERYRWGTYRPWIQAANFAGPPPGEAHPIDQSWFVGSPDEIVEKIGRFREQIPVTDFISWGCPPGMDPKAMIPRLERFARDVMPQLQG
jgi:alkanesulfonate monooxygenase SsuD/methylene tetrahydromethanopterin reductase-like flavin-dependent oxidoreductase (luciferase family)